MSNNYQLDFFLPQTTAPARPAAATNATVLKPTPNLPASGITLTIATGESELKVAVVPHTDYHLPLQIHCLMP